MRGRGRQEFIKHTSALIVTKFSLTLEFSYMFVYAMGFILPPVLILSFSPPLSLSLLLLLSLSPLLLLSLSLPAPLHPDDLMQLVAKLEQQSGNSDGVCRVARQILDFFELHVGDYRMNQVFYNTCMVSAYCLGFAQLVKGRQDSIYTY